MPQKKKKNMPQLKEEIKDFLFNEEGKITKKNIGKIGISLVILGMMLESNASAHNSHSSVAPHTNSFNYGGSGGHTSAPVHSNTHANHSNHSSGGWC